MTWISISPACPSARSRLASNSHANRILAKHTFNILTMDGPAFRRWAQLMHRQSDTLYEDAMIAAIANEYKLTVVTRNVGDFSHFAVPLLNPFTSRADLSR